MIEEILNNHLEIMEMFERASRGELKVDLNSGEILNSAGLPNPHYTDILKRGTRDRAEHPVLKGVITVGYFVIHPIRAYKITSYLQSLLMK